MVDVEPGKADGDACEGTKKVDFRGVEPKEIRKMLIGSGALEEDFEGYLRLRSEGGCAEYLRIMEGEVRIVRSCKPMLKGFSVVCERNLATSPPEGNTESGGESEGGEILKIVLIAVVAVVSALVVIVLLACWHCKKQQKVKVGENFYYSFIHKLFSINLKVLLK